MEQAIPFALDDSLTEAILSNLNFVSPAIVTANVDRVSSVLNYTLRANADAVEVAGKVRALLDRLEPSVAAGEVGALYSRESFPLASRGDVFAQLIARGSVRALGPGIFSFRGDFLRLLRGLDRRVLEFAASQNAGDLSLPVTTPLSLLRRSHFFDRTPQFANFISEVESDADKLSCMAESLRGQDGHGSLRDNLKPPVAMCRSAVCLGAYCLHEGETFGAGDDRCYTVSGPVFRNEGLAVRDLERLQEFSMREIVYFGTPEYVRSRLEGCINWFRGCMESLNLFGHIKPASDPFFAESFRKLQFFQLATQSKLEVRWKNPYSGNHVSVGSVNMHGEHFSKPFEIKLASGGYATTGCVGFGQERFAYLVACQHGADFEAWPNELRRFFYLDG